ncbi:MAG: DUF3606 domain-containing protein [Piscinibacter sp.]|nr:DUF3606 domain-containing protein [Piscinibacter sp.]
MNEPVAAFRPLDPGRINPMDPTEMAWWCRELGCSLDALNRAIEQVGEHVSAVREVLHAAHGPGA